MKSIIKRALIRFWRAFVAGASAALATVTITMPGAWSDVPSILSSLSLIGLIGGLSGVIQALDKFHRDAKYGVMK